MKNQLEELFNHYLEKASDEEMNILKDLLEGLHKKREKETNIYINELLQMERKSYGNTAELTIPITPLLNNVFGVVHGGITATVVDSAMGTFINELLPDDLGAVTTSLNIHFLAPGVGDSIKCVANLEHRGKQTMVSTAEVFRSDGRKIAQATGSFFVVKK